MKLMLRYLRPFMGRFSLGLGIKMLAAMFELALPYILSHVLENVVTTQRMSLVAAWGGAMIFCSAGAMICNIIANRISSRVSCDFSEKVRGDLFEKILRLSPAQIDKFTVPSLESRVTSDTYNLLSFITRIQRGGVRAPTMLIGGIIITLIMDAHLALAMIAMLPLIFITIYFVSLKGVPLYTGVSKAADSMIRVVREDVIGIRVIKAFSKTDYERRRYDKFNASLASTERKAGLIMGVTNPVMTLLMNLGIVAVITLGANRVSGGGSAPETIVAFMQYFTLISNAMMMVTRTFVEYTKSAASARRIDEVLVCENDLAVEPAERYPKKTAANGQSVPHIEFENVSFSYKGVSAAENSAGMELENVSFTLPHGGSLGIIGATGSGKTTLIKLLMRFYDVCSGCVRIDGRDVRTIPAQELYSMFGCAMQNDFLCADTVRENIIFGRDITDDAMKRAAKIAQADDFIESFPDGYDHRLAQKAANISGGQKQRLLISRALAGSPDILILDDSSSALDYKTDAALRSALAEEMAGTTLVTVAQRVSSVKSCDVIIVLEDGKVIGIGDHEYLLQNCETYGEFSRSQMGGAFVE